MQVLAIIILFALTIDFGIRVFAYAETGDPKFKHQYFWWLH